MDEVTETKVNFLIHEKELPSNINLKLNLINNVKPLTDLPDQPVVSLVPCLSSQAMHSIHTIFKQGEE